MRTRAILGSILASGAVLIVGWQAGGTVLASNTTAPTSQPQSSGTTAVTPGPTTTAPSAAPSAAPKAAPIAAPPVATRPADGTYTGSSVSTRYGNVQVAVTISGGSITDVTPLQLTDDGGTSVQISNHAAPILHDEVLASQSAHVTNIGGATYTTGAYLSSLQSALDQAKF